MLLGALLLSLFVQDASELVRQGQELMARQAFEEAERALLRAAAIDPSSARANYYLGVCRMRLGKPDLAAQSLEIAYNLSPRANLAVLYELGSAYLLLERYRDAERVLTQAKNTAPGETRIGLQLGWAYYQLVEGEKAEEEFRAVLEREPSNAIAHFYMGMAEAALGKLEASEGSFRRALELKESILDARLGLARVLSQSGRREEAKAELEKVLEASDSASAHNELGLIALREGRTDDAARHFEAVIAADPEHRQATYNLWLLYRRLKRHDDAEAMRARFEMLKEQDPNERSLSRTTAKKNR